MNSVNIVFIAPPAAGKGTFSKILKEKWGFTHISAGDLLRNVDSSSSVYEEIQEVLRTGALVRGEIIMTLLKEKLESIDRSKGFILDGFPRNLDQAFAFGDLLKEVNIGVDKAIYLDVDIDTALKRVLGRLSCPKCNRDYNSLTGYHTPKNEGLCDDCHTELVKRSDDNEESFKKRYITYQNETAPVIKFFEDLDILVRLDATKDMCETLKELEKELGLGEIDDNN